MRRCTPPQRPPADIATTVRDVLGARAGRVLLLGVTPELVAVGPSVVVVDWSGTAIGSVRRDRAGSRGAVLGDWRRMPLASAAFSSAVGDGCLNCLEYPAGYRVLFDQLAEVVRPGGRIVVRLFVTPDRPEDRAATRQAVLAGAVHSISGVKWRLATAIAAERANANVPVRSIHDAFTSLFPDRNALRRLTQWSSDDIASIDTLADVPGTYSFPTKQEVQEVVPQRLTASFASSGTYELSDRCPLLVLDVTR